MCLIQLVGSCLSEQLGCCPQKLHPAMAKYASKYKYKHKCCNYIMSAHVFDFYVFGAWASQPVHQSESSGSEHTVTLETPWEPSSQRSSPVSSNFAIHLRHHLLTGLSPPDNLSQCTPIGQSVDNSVMINKSNWWKVLCGQLFGL